MKQLAVAFLFVAAWALPFAPVVATAPSEPDVEVETIITKALERATWAQEQNFEARVRHSMPQRARKFNGDGEVTEDETLVYTVEPYQGVPYAKLLTKDGEPIAGDDLKDEEKRWEDFLEMLAEPPKEEEEEGTRTASSSTKSCLRDSRPSCPASRTSAGAQLLCSSSNPDQESCRSDDRWTRH